MAVKDRKVVYTVLSVILLTCLLQLPILYGFARVSTLSCSAVSILKSFSCTGNINASELIRGITAQAADTSPADQSDAHHFSASPNVESKQRSLRPHGYAHYPFVQFSAYRESVRTFYVVGITSVAVRQFDQPVHECEWHSHHNVTNKQVTKAEIIYVYHDQFPRLYVVATVNCSFQHDVGMEDLGGSLIIKVSVKPNPGDTEKVVAMEEQKGATSQFVKKRDNRPPWKFAFCGPPMHGSIRAEWIVHWLVYHHYFWKAKAHFIFYNVGGLQDHHYQLLAPWVKAGYLTIINAIDQREYPSWYHNQLLLANDCLHRTRFLASWTFFHDLDEFLHIPPPTNLLSLLSEHRDAPYITFGSIWADMSLCADLPVNAAHWLVQRLLWMHKRPYCDDVLFDPWVCRHWQGARKYVANPRKVFAAAVHTAALPDVGGSDLNATIARMYHYHGALSTEANMCQVNVNMSLPFDQLKEIVPDIRKYNTDYSLSRTIAKARRALPQFFTSL
ncbi:hypothetical protein O6H91_22G011600 [Diphasiastrum complanatum]|uniref:Uncharacterized protein n=1 Tax=Diphasiastrum complanatum TaxID=34168 RepID=A0ACC2ACS8_DIPCM|nr:hypothetical protein O6H91_22G011600 [Diphasiastrum complanatum]